MNSRRYARWMLAGGAVTVVCWAVVHLDAVALPEPARISSAASARAVLDQYCVGCHNQRAQIGDLALDAVPINDVTKNGDVWEKVVKKLRAGVMPPLGRPRPDKLTYDALASWLETELDQAAARRPNAGRTEALHRLNRAEYKTVIRDLLALDVDITDLLPSDDASYGFDNMAGVLKVSESLLERYLMAARKVSRLAVGSMSIASTAETFRQPSDLAQYDRVEGLPWGTRGGELVQYNAPLDAEYAVRVEFSGGVAGTPEQFELSVDGRRVAMHTVTGATPRSSERLVGTIGFEHRVPLKAGPREIAATFVNTDASYFEQPRTQFAKPRIYDLGGAMRITQTFVASVTVVGPFNATSPGDTPSRRRIFTCRPASEADEAVCARTILSTLARRAYRRPATGDDLKRLLAFYTEGRKTGGFEQGIEVALRRLLVTPDFLFRVEEDPAGAKPGTNYRLNDLELASRLSFFLWSSIPDDELLRVAAAGRLTIPAVLAQQVRRMLADPRSNALIANFLGQWLYLRNVPSLQPVDDLFPDFDAALRDSFRTETELFFGDLMRRDRSVLELLKADYTFVNERLARHYGIPNVAGSHFRRVPLDANRGGLLGQGSILTVNSRPNRTSPVLRGKWIMENLLGTPPPPPPANVPPLPESSRGETVVRTMRERMAQHRANPVCASCHAVIDPLGFALERFDAVGRFRDVDETFKPIDASGALPDGTKFEGLAGLRGALLAAPDRFVTVFTEKLLTYALGRGLESYDAPAVRRIVRTAAGNDYRFSSIVLGMVDSTPFAMRRTPEQQGRKE